MGGSPMTATAAAGNMKVANKAAEPARTEDAIWYQTRIFKVVLIGFAAWVVVGFVLAFFVR